MTCFSPGLGKEIIWPDLSYVAVRILRFFVGGGLGVGIGFEEDATALESESTKSESNNSLFSSIRL
jgi:hypothetical protein